jgi:hypothetical protein
VRSDLHLIYPVKRKHTKCSPTREREREREREHEREEKREREREREMIFAKRNARTIAGFCQLYKICPSPTCGREVSGGV